jgi:hypothetical protein
MSKVTEDKPANSKNIIFALILPSSKNILIIKEELHTIALLGQQAYPKLKSFNTKKASENTFSTNWADNFLVRYRSAH